MADSNTPNNGERTVMLSELQKIDQLQKEDWMYDEEKLKKFLADNAAKYPKQKVSLTSIILQFVKQVKIGADVTRISLPTYLLKPESHLETAAEYSLLSAGIRSVNNIKEPYQRMVRVLQWLLLRSHFVPQKGFECSKPYNPILGEFFECEFAHNESKTTVLVEQVSHHPPISSLFTYNETHNIMYESTMRIASTFRASGNYTYLQGYHCVTLLNFLEQYMLTFPAIIAKPGVLSSTIEYGEFLVVKCDQTGYEARIEGLSNNEYAGFIRHNNKNVAKITGSWREKGILEDLTTNKKYVLVDVAKELAEEAKSTKKIIKPLQEQNSFESRRVWHLVSKCLKLNMLDEAQTQKFAIEDNQRRIRKEKEANKEEFQSKFFVPTNQTSVDGVQLFRLKKYPKPVEEVLLKHGKTLGITITPTSPVDGAEDENGKDMSKMNEEELKATLDLV